ncbi:MAG: LLM class flavin-dependent oxidoreductase [Acidimicrobiia bacterium]|nr:LLM class flavin-dependent oxidoreductase [Acidimicrobiia bacterium]
MNDSLKVAISPPEAFWRAGVDQRRAMVADIVDAGLDGLLYADHVSFRGGSGVDLMVLMAGISQLHADAQLYLGVYLLPLRHPVLVARSLSTLSDLAPGRVVLGVGIGGEDRHEVEVCGVDPRTRGRRCDESLAVLRGLMGGDWFTHHGEFFDIEACRILPPPDPAVPIVVGGRSDAAVRRAGRYGDGWLAGWVSTRRFAEAVRLCGEVADEAGRHVERWQHGLQLWVGLDADAVRARGYVKEGMESFYRIPFDAFDRYTPAGSPEQVADFLRPYVDAGASQINLTPCAASAEAATELTGQVAELLRRG